MARNLFYYSSSSTIYLKVKSRGFWKLMGKEVNSRAHKYNGRVNSVLSRHSLAQDQAQRHVARAKKHKRCGCLQYDPTAIKLVQKFDMIGWQRFLQALTKSVLVQALPLGNLHYSFALVQSASAVIRQHGQILNETSNKAKIEKEIDVLETMNIELEHSVATLRKENETLKQHYKDLLQEKVFLQLLALKNELKGSLKGNSVDTKFDKTSVLGKPVLQSLRNQSVVRQPNAFKSARAQMSKQRFASQVDVNKNLSKPVTQHYLPKKTESAFAKLDHVIASSSSRNSSKNMPRFSSNDMVHNHYLDEARKKTQERDRNSKTSVIPSARFQSTADGSKPKPRSNNQTSRSLPVSKSTRVTITAVPKADHSKSSSSFSDSKQFVCSTCHKCVFNANHDACITKLLKEVNSRAKVPSNKTTNRNKPVEQIRIAKKPERQIPTGHRFSIKQTSAVHEKTMTLRSCLRWKPTGKIFRTVGLRWVPTGKIFTPSTTKVDSEPPNGSNADITNQYESTQTLDVSAGTSNLSAGTSFNPKKEELRVWLLKRLISEKPGLHGIFI
ncbi:hypothetical protein Tco_0425855 [Tanacetum coccineum]